MVNCIPQQETPILNFLNEHGVPNVEILPDTIQKIRHELINKKSSPETQSPNDSLLDPLEDEADLEPSSPPLAEVPVVPLRGIPKNKDPLAPLRDETIIQKIPTTREDIDTLPVQGHPPQIPLDPDTIQYNQ